MSFQTYLNEAKTVKGIEKFRALLSDATDIADSNEVEKDLKNSENVGEKKLRKEFDLCVKSIERFLGYYDDMEAGHPGPLVK